MKAVIRLMVLGIFIVLFLIVSQTDGVAQDYNQSLAQRQLVTSLGSVSSVLGQLERPRGSFDGVGATTISAAKVLTVTVLLVAALNLLAMRIAKGTFMSGSYLLDGSIALLGMLIVYLIGVPLGHFDSLLFSQAEKIWVVVLAMIIFSLQSYSFGSLSALKDHIIRRRRALSVRNAVSKRHSAMMF